MPEMDVAELRHQLDRIEQNQVGLRASQDKLERRLYGPDPMDETYSKEVRDKSIVGRLEIVEAKQNARTKVEKTALGVLLAVIGGFIVKLFEWLFLGKPLH